MKIALRAKRSGDVVELHLAILDDLVSKVLPGVDVLGSLPSTNDIVTPLDARRVIFVDRRWRRLGEPHTLEVLAEVQDLASRRGRQNRVVIRLCRRQCGAFCILDFHMIRALL